MPKSGEGLEESMDFSDRGKGLDGLLNDVSRAESERQQFPRPIAFVLYTGIVRDPAHAYYIVVGLSIIVLVCAFFVYRAFSFSQSAPPLPDGYPYVGTKFYGSVPGVQGETMMNR